MAAPTVAYDGVLWHLRRDGYYGNSRHGLLHRRIYQLEHGPIPAGAHVHHVDHDKGNNDPGNLAAISPSDHFAEHSAERGEGWHAAGARKAWEGREPTDRTCERCGATYRSRATRSRWCGSACRDAGARARAERVCSVCGERFTCQARAATRTCSPPCRATYAYQRRSGAGL